MSPARYQRRNIFGWSKKERTAKRKRVSGGSTDARGAGFRFGAGKSDENFTEWMDRKDFGDEKYAVKERLAAAFSSGYDRGKASVAGKERVERKKEEFAEKQLQKRIDALDKKITVAEKKIDQASERESKGYITPAKFEQIKAHLESEIAKQERAKSALASRNPIGFGVYKKTFMGEEQLEHFTTRAAAETWARSKGLAGYEIKRAFKKNPAQSGKQYRLAQAVLSGTDRTRTGMTRKVAQELVDQTSGKLRSEFSRNPQTQTSTEYRLGYNLGQTDRQTASLCKTPGELHATFAANFGASPLASWDAFDSGYKAGYNGGSGAVGVRSKNNPEPGDGSTEYQQALRTAELFHGRPVKDEIEVTEDIRTHDWYVSIGPLIKLIVKPVTKKPRKRVPLPFHQSESGQVQLFCSPDGRQFYLRGGDQELDLKAFGMGEGSKWFRDHMIIGEAVEITYQDRKKFHSFKLTDYFHKLGEETGDKPTLAYNSLAKKLQIIGGAYHVEMEDLVDGMSPGVVN